MSFFRDPTPTSPIGLAYTINLILTGFTFERLYRSHILRTWELDFIMNLRDTQVSSYHS